MFLNSNRFVAQSTASFATKLLTLTAAFCIPVANAANPELDQWIRYWGKPLGTMGVFSASCTYFRKGEISGARMKSVMDQRLDDFSDGEKKRLAVLIKASNSKDSRYQGCLEYSGLSIDLLR